MNAIAADVGRVGALVQPDRERARALWLDVALGGCLAAAVAALVWWLFGYFGPVRSGEEQWFEADISRVWVVLTDRYSELHERARVHPLFSLVNSTFVYFLRRAFGLDVETAVRLWMSLCAAVWIGLFYATSRLLRFARFDSLLLGVILAGSASALFWISVPETRTVSSISVILCVTAAALHERRPLPDWALIAVAAVSLSMTLSNFMAGLALLVVTRPFRKAVQLSINAFFAVSLLQIVQNFVYWYTKSMTDLRHEGRFLLDPSGGTVFNKLAVIIEHSMVMPPVLTPLEFDTHAPFLSIQKAALGSSGLIGGVAIALWSVALVWGAVRLWKALPGSMALKTCGLAAVGQLVFHLVYGDQTFMYSLHFVPLFVLIAAQVMAGPRAAYGRALLCALAVTCAVNNARQVVYAHQVFERILPLGIHADSVGTPLQK